MLVGSDDVVIHVVGVFVSSDCEFELGVENKILSSALFPPGNVLDAKAVSIEPWQEDISYDTLNTVC
jgi:hypothetical protein